MEPISTAVGHDTGPVDGGTTGGAAAGEDRRWERLADLYRREQPGLVRLATLLVRNSAVAEELVQEAFVRLHRHLDGAEYPGAYLRTTVVNLCHSHGRRVQVAARHAPDPPPVAPPPGLPPDLSPVWLALDLLSERQRDAVVLRFYLDLPDAEIAALLGVRPGTVRSLVSRALARLQEVLEP